MFPPEVYTATSHYKQVPTTALQFGSHYLTSENKIMQISLLCKDEENATESLISSQKSRDKSIKSGKGQVHNSVDE